MAKGSAVRAAYCDARWLACEAETRGGEEQHNMFWAVSRPRPRLGSSMATREQAARHRLSSARLSRMCMLNCCRGTLSSLSVQ